MFPLMWRPRAAGMRLTCGASSRLDPRVTARGGQHPAEQRAPLCVRRLLGQGQGRPRQRRLRAVVASGPSRSRSRRAGCRVCRTNRNKQGLRAPGSRVPASPGELGWRAGGLPRGAPEPCTGTPLPSPAPAPEKPPAAATVGTAWGRAVVLRGWGWHRVLRACFLEELTAGAGQRHFPAAPGPVAQGCESPGWNHAQPSPAASPARRGGRTGAVSQRLTYCSYCSHCSRAPRFATRGEDRETGSSQRRSGSRGSACGGLAPAQPEQTTDSDLKCNRLRPPPPPEGTVAPGPSPRPRPSPHVEQPRSAAVLGQPAPGPRGGPQGSGERTPLPHHA